jgi:ribosomal protein S27E
MSEPETGWISALIKCDLCAHESLSVHHESADKLECVNCGNMSHFEVLEYYTDEEL